MWLLRTLLVLLLGLAFAQPVLRNATGALSRTERDIAIVLDASYSMNYEMERAKVWDICKEAAENMISGLKVGDRVCVYLAADPPLPVIERPTTEHAAVSQAIRGLEITQGTAKLEEAVAMAVKMLEQQEGKREKELYIYTDGQSLSWQGFRQSDDAGSSNGSVVSSAPNAISREAREKFSVFVLLAGALNPANVYPASLKLSPALMLAGQNARVAARIGCSGSAREVTVSLSVDGEERAKRSITAAADTETSVDMVLSGLEPGVHVAKLSTPQDALTDDDAFQFLIRVNRQLPALIAGTPEASRYLRAALAPGASDESVKQVTPAELEGIDLRDYQAVFLCDAFPLSGQTILRLEAYATAGGVLVIFPGDSADVSAYSELKILPALPIGQDEVPVEESARQIKHVPNQPGQVVNFTLSLPAGAIPTVALKRHLTFGELQENAAVLLNAGDETPFMLGRAAGRGRVFMFAVGADRAWSTLPLTAFYLPVVHQLVRQGAGASVQPPYLIRGAGVPANEAIPNFREDDQITMPSGMPLPIKDSGDQVYAIEVLPEAGIYQRAKATGAPPEPVLAVNTERSESVLTPIADDELKSWTGFRKLFVARDTDELDRMIEDQRSGRSLTELLLWLAALAGLAEWWFANRALRTQTGAIEKMRVNLAGKVTNS